MQADYTLGCLESIKDAESALTEAKRTLKELKTAIKDAPGWVDCKETSDAILGVVAKLLWAQSMLQPCDSRIPRYELYELPRRR